MVEFAIVVDLLMVFVLGGLTFGLLLAYRHSFEEVTSEAARAAVVVPDDPGTVADERVDAAMAVMNASEGLPGHCDDAASGLTCTATVAACPGDPGRTCITARIVVDRGVNPLVGRIPLLDGVLPQTVSASAAAVVG